MPWGRPNAYARCSLNYQRIKKEIEAKGNRGRKGEFQIGNSVWARMVGKDIALKLHATDIITYHPDGSKTFDCRGWIDSNLTRHWFSEAGYRIFRKKMNPYTANVWMLRQYGPDVPYHDGMRVNSHGQLIGEPEPLTMNVPNAEAKVLRKRMLATYTEHYLPHLQFIALMNDWQHEIRNWPKEPYHYRPNNDNPFLKKVEDPLPLIARVLVNEQSWRFPDRSPIAIFRAYFDKAYRNEVITQQLLDEVPYQPKENSNA